MSTPTAAPSCSARCSSSIRTPPRVGAAGGLHIHRFEPAEAIQAFQRALRLSPLDPMSFYARQGIGEAHLLEGRLEEALRFSQQALSERPRDHMLKRRVCALLAVTGEIEQARRLVPEIPGAAPAYHNGVARIRQPADTPARHHLQRAAAGRIPLKGGCNGRLAANVRDIARSCSGRRWLLVCCSCCPLT
jgi:tetratricopeptide (TPR) repeat protein